MVATSTLGPASYNPPSANYWMETYTYTAANATIITVKGADLPWDYYGNIAVSSCVCEWGALLVDTPEIHVYSVSSHDRGCVVRQQYVPRVTVSFILALRTSCVLISHSPLMPVHLVNWSFIYRCSPHISHPGTLASPPPPTNPPPYPVI